LQKSSYSRSTCQARTVAFEQATDTGGATSLLIVIQLALTIPDPRAHPRRTSPSALQKTLQEESRTLLGDYLATLRNHHPLAGDITPPVSLDEVLRALRPALPDGFDDYQALVAKARQEVPMYHGDPNV
jgi:hypothetical protein